MAENSLFYLANISDLNQLRHKGYFGNQGQNGQWPQGRHHRNGARPSRLRECGPGLSRVGIIYVGNAALSVATVGTISDMMVAGLAQDGAIEAAGSVAAPVRPICMGRRRRRRGKNGVDVGDILQFGLQGLMSHGRHLEPCRRGSDL